MAQPTTPTFGIFTQGRRGMQWHAVVDSAEEAQRLCDLGDFDHPDHDFVLVIPGAYVARDLDSLREVVGGPVPTIAMPAAAPAPAAQVDHAPAARGNIPADDVEAFEIYLNEGDALCRMWIESPAAGGYRVAREVADDICRRIGGGAVAEHTMSGVVRPE